MAAVRLLLLVPFIVSALLPKGFMPEVQAQGGFTVTLCTTEGLRTVSLDAAGHEIPPASDRDSPAGKASQHCVFAGIGAFAVPDIVPFVPAMELAARQPGPVLASVWTPHQGPGQHGARAPPLSV
ncbi:DUF2946 family protein [Roseibium sp. M-1]